MEVFFPFNEIALSKTRMRLTQQMMIVCNLPFKENKTHALIGLSMELVV